MNTDKLPIGWTRVRLGDVVEQIKDRVDFSAESTRVYVPGGSIGRGNFKIAEWLPVDDGLMGPAFHMVCRSGDVLYKSRVPHGVAVADRSGICANTTYVLRTRDESVLLQDLLPHLLSTDLFLNHESLNDKGSTNLYLNFSDIAKYEFALPPIDEQRRIATLLVTADRASDSNADLAQSASSLADAVRHNEIERDYAGPTRTLGDTASIGLGRVYPSNEYCDDGVLLLRPGNIAASGRIDWSRGRTHLPQRFAEERGAVHVAAGDIIMNLTAQSLEDGFLGRVCLADEGDEGILNQRIARLRSWEYDQRYLFHVLQHQRFRRQVDSAAKGSKIKHLYERDLVGFPVPAPGLERQAEVVSRVETARRVADDAASAAATLRLMSRVLREDLLTGGDGRVQ